MVGVPGKFKGCNTCRTRRVKCDNARPKCQKCVASGRECGGYERQMVFIVGTTSERGRCSSHPHRSIMTPKQKVVKEKESTQPTNANRSDERERPATIPPVLTSQPQSDDVSCVFLHSPSLALDPSFDAEDDMFSLPGLSHSLPEFSDPDSTREFSLHAFSFVQGSMASHRPSAVDGDVNPRAKKKAHIEVETSQASSYSQAKPATTLLFIYNLTGAPAGEAGPFRWLHGGASTEIKSRGPSSFQRFPNHQFFAKLYRPFACFDAMSRCQSSFLARPEWCAGPWERIPKTDMDRLFDIQVMLPGIFERARRTESFPPSPYRRLKAKDLLDNCTRLDKSFEEWYNDVKSHSDRPLFWLISDGHSFNSQRRDELDALFPTSIEFVDVETAFLHLNYWAALCLFYQTIQQVQQNCIEITTPSPARSTTYSPPVPSNSTYSPPTTRAFAEQPSGAYISSSSAYSTPSPHVSVSVSPPATMYNPVPFEPSIYIPPTYPSFPRTTYATSTYTTPSIPATYPSPSVPNPTFALPTPTPLYSNAPYDYSESFLFSTASAAAPPDVLSSLPYQNLSLNPTPPFYFPHSPSPPPPQPPSSRAPTPTLPSLDAKFSATAIGELARRICQGILYVIRHDGGGAEMLVWPLRCAGEVFRDEGWVEGVRWCGAVGGVLKGLDGREGRGKWMVVGGEDPWGER